MPTLETDVGQGHGARAVLLDEKGVWKGEEPSARSPGEPSFHQAHVRWHGHILRREDWQRRGAQARVKSGKNPGSTYPPTELLGLTHICKEQLNLWVS